MRGTDLDVFYSSVPIETWRQILGDHMHYHHGVWQSDEDWDTALENAVLDLARHVEPGSTVLDLGCGWGGPASVLKERYGCPVRCVTVSQAQASYCNTRGLDVHRADLDSEIPEGTWAVGWWMESLEHLEQPEKALAQLRQRCRKVVIRANTCEAGPRQLFAGSMPMQSTRFYLDALERTGWRVTHAANRRAESLRSPFEWLAGLNRSGAAWSGNPHLRALWEYSVFFSTNPSMYAVYPLMDIIAE